ncbi:hypothetical protein PIB30_005002 [Stylosanthes scabra]|uniref:Ubiquitin-like protease family profile domain-containing protein n=1 Tax=Stylosanthes scabra TaxID=79078 RepID=A0ABU6Y0H2_9FABA|nr:hypothetical protein [Stylosanthes scabra]
MKAIHNHALLTNDGALGLLCRILEHLQKEKENMSTMMNGQNEKIESLKEMLADQRYSLASVLRSLTAHRQLLELLAANKEPISSKKAPRSRRSRVVTKEDYFGTAKTPSPNGNSCAIGDPALKSSSRQQRILDFDDEDSSDGPLEVRRRGPGSSFTYFSHVAHNMDGVELPMCIHVIFPPPHNMEFTGMELAVAAYIFGLNFPKSDIMVLDEHCLGSRGVLRTLCPREQLVDDVLKLVVGMCTKRFDASAALKRWWLPTTFQQIELNQSTYYPETLGYIKRKFMGYADNLFKIYVPLYKDNHWYLMIIDFHKKELVYLDSMKVESAKKARKDHMLFVDCGVYVAQWMIQAHLWSDYNIEVVDDETRMRLALDLVMGRHNTIRTDIGCMALNKWDRLCRRAARRAGRRNPTGTSNPSA